MAELLSLFLISDSTISHVFSIPPRKGTGAHTIQTALRLVVGEVRVSAYNRAMFRSPFSSLTACCALMFFATACDQRPGSPAPAPAQSPAKVVSAVPTNTAISGMQSSPLDTTNVARSFVARGVIRQIPAGGQTVFIKHEEIPGFMPKMTMEFELRDTNELKGFKEGDLVSFQVRADANESWIEKLKHAGTNDPSAILPGEPSNTSLLHVAKLNPGDPIPDAELISENGGTIRFSDLKGTAFAFTFIFTRCPLPDFCPRMSQHFAKARNLLEQRQGGPTKWQFISISFDPEFDKPGVLTRYAFSYRGNETNRWLFTAAPTNVLSALTAELDFRFANEGGSFLHNLRTVVVDPKTRVFKQFDGNRWTATELADAMAEAAKID